MKLFSRIAVFSLIISCLSCYPQPGPDKSIVGGVLGAGWGAGAGAVIGHQVGAIGPGTAIGAGFGAVSGMLTGVGLDLAEGHDLQMQREFDALKVQVAANQRTLTLLQNALDERQRQLGHTSTGGTVFFDKGRASLRGGSVAQLQRLSNQIKFNPYIGRIQVHGHSDDTGDTERNMRLSEARARSVATFLGNQGISLDSVITYAHGAKRPLASNETEMGRQLNRRAEVVVLR